MNHLPGGFTSTIERLPAPPIPARPTAGARKHRKCDVASHSKDAGRGPAETPVEAPRRSVLGAAVWMASCAAGAQPAEAVQGLTAGRIPGISPDPELEGVDVYTRPQGKSGGHGVGWSEIPNYSFRVPQSWQEIPVSIADLGGTEIDLRFRSPAEGDLSVVVAPVLRFRDVGYNANVNMEFLGDPDKIIAGFCPELFGAPLTDGDVLDTKVIDKKGSTYYQWSLKPHRMVAATATGNRVFLLAVSANSRQFRKGSGNLELIVNSFFVPPAKNYSTGF